MKTIVFDLDNTIIDSKGKLDRDLIKTFNRLGYSLSEKDLKKDWHEIISSYGISKNVFNKEFAKRKSWEDSIKNGEVKLFPDTVYALEKLKKKGHQILLLSHQRQSSWSLLSQALRMSQGTYVR